MQSTDEQIRLQLTHNRILTEFQVFTAFLLVILGNFAFNKDEFFLKRVDGILVTVGAVLLLFYYQTKRLIALEDLGWAMEPWAKIGFSGKTGN